MEVLRTLLRRRNSFALLLLLTTLAACQTGTPRKPKVKCATTQHLTAAALCLKAVTLDLGPADGLEGYTPISNFSVLLLPEGAIAINDDGSLQQPSADLLQEIGAGAKTTDEDGNLTLFIEPAEYVLCLFRISPDIYPGKLAHCEQITVQAGSPTEIFVQHTPMGGFITFEINN